ncbi:MAG TPA: DNA polymerase III subunit gamma/tau [Anaerolineales bacterium]|nr:DNA polymerase III subunit gamma/tau [Anaerolineales bacterium]
MSQALYLRWRPRSWDEVVGQEHIVRTLRNAVRSGRTVHAYLFAGPRGTGKTTTARLLAKALNCVAPEADRPCNACANCQAVNEGRFLDLIEIDAASNTSVDDVRDLRDKINFRPSQGVCKVYLIDEVHMLSTAAFNALLKTLEEPPPHAVFILATTEVHKIPLTVLSRCQRHEFRRVPAHEIAAHLENLCRTEGLAVEPAALALIARAATGSFRDAISLLDQLSSTGETVTLERAQAVLGTAASEAVAAVLEAIARGDGGRGMSALQSSLDGGSDPRQLARQIVDHLRGVLLTQMGQPDLVDAPAEVRAEMARWASLLARPTVLAGLRAFGRAAVDARLGWQPGLSLELALMDTLQGQGPSAPAPAGPAGPTAAAGPSTNASPPAAREPAGPPAAPSKKAGAASPEAGVTAKAVAENWEAILQAAFRLDTRTQALLRSGKLLGVREGRVVIGFPTEILREKMEKGHSLTHARQAIEQVLGVRVDVRCVLLSHWSGDETAAPAETILEEGMVATAVRELGGHVVAVRPAPGQESQTNA